MKKIILFLVLFTSFCFADVLVEPTDINSPELKKVFQLLKKNPVTRSNFVQKKKISFLKHPLISKGFLIFSQKDGLYWKVNHPLMSSFLVTDNVVIEKNYRAGQVISSKQHRQLVQQFVQIFMQLFSGDLSQLAEHFKLYLQKNEAQWRINLVPKDVLISKAAKAIQVTGKSQIEELIIFENNGDSTTYSLTFKSADPLRNDELSLFSDSQ